MAHSFDRRAALRNGSVPASLQFGYSTCRWSIPLRPFAGEATSAPRWEKGGKLAPVVDKGDPFGLDHEIETDQGRSGR